jgi:hypothetical protein
VTAARSGNATTSGSSLPSGGAPAATPDPAGPGGPRGRRRRTGSIAAVRTRRNAGVLVVALGLLCIPLGLTAIRLGYSAAWPVRLSVYGFGAMMIGVSRPVIRLGRRLRVTAGDWTTVEQDPRPPVVYLRPFETDGVEAPRRRGRLRPVRSWLGETTFEQRVARLVADVAPMLAIANPSEALPEMGAKRLSACDDEWRDKVASLTSRAGTIIVHSGASDGLAWEIEHALDRRAPERVIVVLPLDASRGQRSREERYASFAARFATVFPRGLPDRAGDSQFLFFDADWTPHRFGQRGSQAPAVAPGSPGEQRALVLERLRSEFRVSPFPFWLRAAAGSAAFIVGGIAVAVAIYAALS